ncbi:Phospholipid/glycerol acyltransferase [Hyella patelloides LEGE 07179]|uniref:Phospholipid/glycerol acyltransferase n=1 Tax=Hyella patelloides LEGE 07179 TaxID=945734 RepID=A0A563VK88_9CYAN|nr:lysophospholipid acyltransferase family protein [Hyella patelloides]VEP11747.1 Phospholipid/glycerol acyltransferase [Hyella patelloides LEGE 07179]
MPFNSPQWIARSLIASLNIKKQIYYAHRIPQDIPVIVISNHRSFLDAALLISSVPYELRIACHHYMGQTPGLKEFVNLLGCFPLAAPGQKQKHFFATAENLLASRQWVGLFPEGTKPMVEKTNPREIGKFQRGFAHLAYKMPVDNLVILPVAIASLSETISPTFPIRWLTNFDASEPLFHRDGMHPMVMYHRVNLLFGRPYSINRDKKQQYQGKQAKQLVNSLTNYCQTQIAELLKEGC